MTVINWYLPSINQKQSSVIPTSFSSGTSDSSVLVRSRSAQGWRFRRHPMFRRQGWFSVESSMVLSASNYDLQFSRNDNQSAGRAYFGLANPFRHSRPQRRLHLHGPQSSRNVEFHGNVERQWYWLQPYWANQIQKPFPTIIFLDWF